LPACEYTTVSVSPYTMYVKPGFSRGLTPATSSPRRAPIATCDGANLRLGRPLTGPAGGTVYQNIAIRNLGVGSCEIRSVSAWYVDAFGRRIGALAQKAVPLAGPVTISPNVAGHVIVGFGNPANYKPSECLLVRPSRLRSCSPEPATSRFRRPSRCAACPAIHPTCASMGAVGRATTRNESMLSARNVALATSAADNLASGRGGAR
jgi:hypothetical protein